jgi:hypothetical protein
MYSGEGVGSSGVLVLVIASGADGLKEASVLMNSKACGLRVLGEQLYPSGIESLKQISVMPHAGSSR